MIRLFKPLLIMIFVLATLSVLAITAFATSRPLLVDEEDIFTFEEEESLESLLGEISQKHRCELVVVTTATYGNKSARAFAESFYDNNGYGYGNDGTGVLLLISESNREYYICLTGEANDAFSRTRFNALENEILPELKQNDFYGAAFDFARKSDEILIKYESEKGSLDWQGFWVGVVISIIVAIVAGAITIVIMRRAMNNARPQKNATMYVKNGSFNLTVSRDMYLYSTIRRVAKPKSSSSGRSGGRSHGGGGGRF
ncbi:MAG: TPM domain-containing protein [Clostridia bacterium]|nr:TPM domain-containing protein [Clostridia bacterium]